MFENVRPHAIKKAAEILQNSEVYKYCEIQLDFKRNKSDLLNLSNHEYSCNTDKNNENSDVNNFDLNDNEDNDSSDENSEDEEPVNVEDESTLLMTQAIVFAPGEGQMPVSLFDLYAEALSFIKIYGGKLMKKPEHLTDEESDDDFIDNSPSMKLTDNSGFVRRRKKSKIIRFINYNKDADKENFIRENVMLFVPWRNENILIMSASELFSANYNLIKERRSEYVYNENIESILKEATHKANESDNENDISTFTPKNLEVVNDPSQTGDIAIDMKINIDENSTSTCNNKDLCYVSIPRLISEENYINLQQKHG
ncbi:Protein of unknown function [Cotesia congregata]|uniref:Uncharacterized protein n=1 Tax=Cotesia congregata TaxID=51543 RepID=A0A8J2HM93_COTCN|nr:Protein of unknown function [Cotesia congregata]